MSTITHESHAPSAIGPRFTDADLPPHWREQTLTAASAHDVERVVPLGRFRRLLVLRGGKE